MLPSGLRHHPPHNPLLYEKPTLQYYIHSKVAHFMCRKIEPKFCLWTKNDKYEVCIHPLSTQSPIIRESHFKSASSSWQKKESSNVLHSILLGFLLLLYSTGLSVHVLFVCLKYQIKRSTSFQIFFHIHFVPYCLNYSGKEGSMYIMGGVAQTSHVSGDFSVLFVFLQWPTLPLCYSITHQLSNNTRIIE